MSSANDPAFPHHEVWDGDKTDIGWIGGGLSKREYFAAMAMQGLLACNQHGVITVCEGAVEYADALIRRLSRSNEERSGG